MLNHNIAILYKKKVVKNENLSLSSVTSMSGIDYTEKSRWEFIKHRMWKKQSKRKLCNQLENESELRRCLNYFDLICYGLGANIGSNFFLFIGELLLIAGPSICISFFVGGVISMITAVCFAELSSRIPTNGGQYSYVYIYYGECIGWIAFVLMSFEYGLSSALNAVGFMHTLKVAINEVGFSIPDYWISTDIWKDVISINPAATIMIVLLILLMLRGIKESITVNNIFTVGIMLFYQYANVLSIAIFDYNKAQPFFRNGEIGVMRGAAVAFFGYTSFEQPITVAEEAINPQRDLPKSLTRQIMIETVQYSVLAYLVSGFINIDKIDPSNENTQIPNGLKEAGYPWHGYFILIGTLIGMFPAVLDSLLSQTRILYRVSKDKVIGKRFMSVNPKTKVPQYSVIFTGVVILVIVLLFDISFLAQFISLSTLCGYCLIMSIVAFKKMARKTWSAVLQGLLFFLSMALGFIHSMQTNSDYLLLTILAGVILNILVILIEAKVHPDLATMQEDERENLIFKDKPYTCMWNPFLPSIGISCSALVIGYMDIVVWSSFFIGTILIGISYFLYVIPRKHKEKLSKMQQSQKHGNLQI